MEGKESVSEAIGKDNPNWRKLDFCNRISCLNHYEFYLSWVDGKGYGLSIKPTNVKLQDNESPIGMFINCLFCSHRKPVDMFIKQMPVKEESKLILPDDLKQTTVV